MLQKTVQRGLRTVRIKGQKFAAGDIYKSPKCVKIGIGSGVHGHGINCHAALTQSFFKIFLRHCGLGVLYAVGNYHSHMPHVFLSRGRRYKSFHGVVKTGVVIRALNCSDFFRHLVGGLTAFQHHVYLVAKGDYGKLVLRAQIIVSLLNGGFGGIQIPRGDRTGHIDHKYIVYPLIGKRKVFDR